MTGVDFIVRCSLVDFAKSKKVYDSSFCKQRKGAVRTCFGNLDML